MIFHFLYLLRPVLFYLCTEIDNNQLQERKEDRSETGTDKLQRQKRKNNTSESNTGKIYDVEP